MLETSRRHLACPLTLCLLTAIALASCGRSGERLIVARDASARDASARVAAEQVLETSAQETSPRGANLERKDLEGNSAEEIRDVAVESGLLGLTIDSPRFLDFEKRFSRLLALVGAGPLAALRAASADHGAYDFGASRPPALTWKLNSLESWSRSMKGVCESSLLASKLPRLSELDSFFEATLGRIPDADDRAALAPILQDPSLDDASKRSLVCRVVLSSAEFNHANAQDRRSSGNKTLTGEDYALYLGRLAPTLAGRSPTPAERDSARAEGRAGVEKVLRTWVDAPGFVVTARDFANRLLSLNGKSGDVNLDEPGNLMARLVTRREPYHDFFAAATCVNDKGDSVACDSGAPAPAGFLTTRAFLSGLYSRYNLKRARKFAQLALCSDYPMDTRWQPHVEKSELIPMFGAKDAAEAAAAGANEAGFGNGTQCHACHGQFAAHAQFFVKFNSVGRWIADSTGLQGTGVQPGESRTGLATSHFRDPAKAGDGFGHLGSERYGDIQAAARGLAGMPRFWQCQVKHIVAYAFQAEFVPMEAFPEAALAEVAASAGARVATLTPQALFTHVLASDKVIRSALFTAGRSF